MSASVVVCYLPSTNYWACHGSGRAALGLGPPLAQNFPAAPKHRVSDKVAKLTSDLMHAMHFSYIRPYMYNKLESEVVNLDRLPSFCSGSKVWTITFHAPPITHGLPSPPSTLSTIFLYAKPIMEDFGGRIIWYNIE